MSDKSERNRKIAEWLGWKQTEHGSWRNHRGNLTVVIPDFYTSEEASALVLDALKRPYPYFSICFNVERSKTEFEASGLSTNRNWCWETEIADRKAAIAECALHRRLIEETGGQRT